MEAGVGQGPGDNLVLSVETGGPQTIAHWYPTPDLAHTDTQGLDKPALSGPPKPQSCWRDFGGLFYFYFLPNSFLFVHRKVFAAF